MVRKLAVPLKRSQITAATRLHGMLAQWEATDAALDALQDAFPSFVDLPHVLLKVSAVNQLYGTNLKAVTRMAGHIVETFSARPSDEALVDAIAELGRAPGQKKDRRHVSFASKFAHFFVDAKFPIYDSYALRVLKMHLGRGAVKLDADGPARSGKYAEYVEALGTLRSAAGLKCTPRELDEYLWLKGLSLAFGRSSSAPINVEAAELFRSARSKPAVAAVLRAL